MISNLLFQGGHDWPMFNAYFKAGFTESSAPPASTGPFGQVLGSWTLGCQSGQFKVD